MDLERVFPVGSKDGVPCRAVLGWSDTQRQYYACIETDVEFSDIFWKLPPDPGLSDVNTIMAITDSVVEALTGEEGRLNPSTEDITALQEAPSQRLVDPSTIVRLDMLDTDYAAQLAADEASASETEESICMATLNYCVEVLSEIQQRENNQELYAEGSFIERRSTILAQTIADMVPNIEALGDAISDASAHRLATGDYTQLWSLESVVTAEEMTVVDRYVQSLCGSALSGFELAVSRGYNPVDGRYLDGIEPYGVSQAAQHSGVWEAMLQGNVLSHEDAARFNTMVRGDPRNRNEDDWQFLGNVAEQLAIQAQHIESVERLV